MKKIKFPVDMAMPVLLVAHFYFGVEGIFNVYAFIVIALLIIALLTGGVVACLVLFNDDFIGDTISELVSNSDKFEKFQKQTSISKLKTVWYSLLLIGQISALVWTGHYMIAIALLLTFSIGVGLRQLMLWIKERAKRERERRNTPDMSCNLT